MVPVQVTTLTQALYFFRPVRLSLFVYAENNNTGPGFRLSLLNGFVSCGHGALDRPRSVADYEIRILDTGV